MRYFPYGSTGIEVSAIGLGGMRFSDYDDVDACAGLVKSAYDAGVNYFDTAPGYGGGKSEEVMGLAFAEMGRTRRERPFYVATKSSKSLPGDVRKDLETSLRRLNVDCIDFYHVWWVLSRAAWDGRRRAGAMRAFEKARKEGLVRHVCISSHMPGREIGEVLAEYPFDGVLLGYSAMNFAYREEALMAAARLGKGVAVMNPLGGGLIPRNPDRFAFVRTRPDETVVEGALRFLINDQRISTAVVGASNHEHLAEALAAVEGFRPIPAGRVSSMREEMQESFAQLCTSCGYCDLCPQGIPVHKYLEAHTNALLSGKPEDAINRLRWHWGVDPDDDTLGRCNGCGACERACTQHLPIRDRLSCLGEVIAKARKEGKP